VRLCPRLHSNPRHAIVCSECGSRELTTPQPRLPFWIPAILFLLTFLPGAVLLSITSLYFIAYIYVLFVRPALIFRFMLFGLPIGLIWLVYMELQTVIRLTVLRKIRNKYTE
jgi:hypothetical protein